MEATRLKLRGSSVVSENYKGAPIPAKKNTREPSSFSSTTHVRTFYFSGTVWRNESAL